MKRLSFYLAAAMLAFACCNKNSDEPANSSSSTSTTTNQNGNSQQNTNNGSDNPSDDNDEPSDNEDDGFVVVSPKLGTGDANPIIDYMFCADPTAVEYDGRLYVYGTNDHQQYEEAEKNSYEKIKTLVMVSTDDMVNWTYHGLIPVGTIAPWIMASWAPSIISKPQGGGTLFSLYFSNSGWGTGVIQAKSPVGPWTSPLNTSLIDGDNETVKNSGSIFDPGAVIDDNGEAWLAVGSGQGWLIKLNDDLHSFSSDPVKLPSPYHFEANELNFINGTYVYTFNNDWSAHDPWTWGGTKPTACSMNYFTSKTPLDYDSWTFGANYFKNTGEYGLSWSNNHTHLHKYQGKWYLFYQSAHLQEGFGTDGGFRSIYVNEIDVDEDNVVISECIATKKGVTAIKNLNPLSTQNASTSAATHNIVFKETSETGHTIATVGSPCIRVKKAEQGIIEVRNVDFTSNPDIFKCRIRGNGSIAITTGKADNATFAEIESSSDSWQNLTAECQESLDGVQTLYLVLKGSVEVDTWSFGN